MHDISGICFIGDPHITTRRPARRLDENFSKTALNKFKQAIQFCNKNDFCPVILGDLFDCSREANPRTGTRLLSDLCKILKTSHLTPIAIPGNHDMHDTTVTPDTYLAVLEATGLVEILDVAAVKRFILPDNQIIALYGVPYGVDLPANMDGFRQDDDDQMILITHHDLGFYTYPGTISLQEIQGADHVVNGHIHLWQDPQKHGSTTFHNPGTILRKKIVEKDHKPSLLTYDGQWTRYFLNHESPDTIFDLSGRQVEAEAKEVETIDDFSAFAEALKESQLNDNAKSEDAGFLKETLDTYFKEKEITPNVQNVIWGLLNRQNQ